MMSDVNGFLWSSLDIKKAQGLVALGLTLLLSTSLHLHLVPMAGFEPARLASPPPQDGVSTNFTTSALITWVRQPHHPLQLALLLQSTLELL